MGVDVARQLQVSLGAAMLGIKLCLVCELARVLGYFLSGAFWRFVLDLGRVLWCGAATFAYFRRAADGQIRLYDLLILLSSAWLFHFCIGRFIVRPLRAVIRLVLTALRKTLALLFYPLSALGRLLRKIVGVFAKITASFLKKVFIFLKRYIIMLSYPNFRKKNKVKEAPRVHKREEKEQGKISRFYH